MTRQQRISNLVRQQGSSAEDPFLYQDVIAYDRHATTTPGVNETYVVFFEYGWIGFHKPFAGIAVPNAYAFGHHPDDVPINECAAWRLAHRLGQPHSDLVPPTVLRECGGRPGSLAGRKEGIPHAADALQVGQYQALAAAFFDAAQQDKHTGNYRWNAQTQELGLIDHGYTFALPGDRANASLFVGWRLGSGHHVLGSSEKEALDALLGSGDLMGLRAILAEDRADALERRARDMLQRGALLAPGEF